MSVNVAELPSRILVVLEKGERGHRAALWASDAATRLDAKVVGVATVDNASSEHSPSVEVGFEMETTMALRAWLGENHASIDDFIVVEQGLDDRIVEEATRNDLVVVGADSHEGVTKWALGSRPHDLAHRLPCPLVLTPPTGPIPDDAPIVVGLDGTDANSAVVDWAKALADALHRPLLAVHARDPMYDTFDSAGDKGPVERAARREAQIEDVTIHERAGDPSVILGELAQENSAFLVVVGARQQHSLGGVLLGHIADHLIHTPPANVAILTHDFLG